VSEPPTAPTDADVHASHLQRLALQQLQGWQRAGVRFRPAIVPPVPPATSEHSPRATAPPRSRAETRGDSAGSRPTFAERAAVLFTPAPAASVVGSSQSGSEPTPAPMADLMPKRSPGLDPSRCQTFVPLELAPEERVSRLEALRKRVAACTLCQELAETRTQTVFGVGDPQARLLFLGEAPGADEDRQGEPFVGRAGQLLNDIIKACRLKREEIYICNVLRCRPPGNRLPAPAEAENCREYLDAQIAIVNPEYIVCWGTTAARNLLGRDDPIGKLRGQLFQYGRARVLCTYHPSYLLRNPAAKKDVWDDLKFLFREMGIDLSAKP
jgi:uracil-DNA glycosylase